MSFFVACFASNVSFAGWVLWRLMTRLCPLCRCYRWTWRNAWWTPIPAFALTGWWRLSAPLDTTWRPPCCTSSGRSETRPAALDSEQTDRLLCTSTAPLKHPLLWIYVYTHLHWTFIDEHLSRHKQTGFPSSSASSASVYLLLEVILRHALEVNV